MLSTAGLLGLAFAMPAQADDSVPSSPPLMLGKSAVITPDDPEAQPVADASVPAPAPAESSDVTTPQEAETPGAMPVVPTQPAPTQVISAPPQPAAKPAQRTDVRVAAGWYQPARKQYRAADDDEAASAPKADLGTVRPAADSASLPVRPDRRPMRIPCDGTVQKCLQFCAADSHDNVPGNGRSIGRCISPGTSSPALERLHALLLERLRIMADVVRIRALSAQYQCAAAQYQESACIEVPQIQTAPTPHAANSKRRIAVRHIAGPEQLHVGRVLAAVATVHKVQPRSQRPASVKRPPRPTHFANPGMLPAQAAPQRAAGTKTTSDRFLTSLLVLVAVAGLGLFVTVAFGSDAVATTFTGARTRAGSRGLTTSRVSLPDREASDERPSAIAYRD